MRDNELYRKRAKLGVDGMMSMTPYETCQVFQHLLAWDTLNMNHPSVDTEHKEYLQRKEKGAVQ